MLFAVAMNYVLADVALALTALMVGFLSGLFYYRYFSGMHRAADSEDALDPHQAENDAERTSMAVEEVRALTESVASDVSDHSERVSHFSQELGTVDGNSAESSAAVAAAVAEMIAANDRLQSRLEDAEQKIRTQAEEIRVQQSEARTDALTNLANRRAFDDAVAVCSDRFHAGGVPFSLILLDVDHFKAFNDLHGHQAGDEVLRRVSRTLQEVVKKSDSPCRYGGEEFAVVMPNSNVAQGRVAAERVRKAIEAMVIDFEGERLKVTASVGVAAIHDGEQSGPFIRRADDAVYAGKKAGRNNSHWHDGSTSLPIDLDEPAAEAEAEASKLNRALGGRGRGGREDGSARRRRVPRGARTKNR
ncbi:GGDEF domain-containing protein [Pirellulales bacterium]|nr:GGDEF domain-containing protein [Pirellulales bacterium]